MGKLILALIAVFGLFAIIRRYNSAKKGEPAKDELSKMTLEKASSLSFYVSLYLWLVISYFNHEFNLETEQVIGYGIIGMAIIFVIFWTFFKIVGIKN